MKYVGSKNKLRKEIVPIIQHCIDRNNIRTYIEPFVGGANVIDKIKCQTRIGIDSHKYLIALLKYIQLNNLPIDHISEEIYQDTRKNKDKYEDWFVGLVGFCATYGAKWFGGYARGFKADGKTPRNHSNESIRNLQKQIPNLKDINFIHGNYIDGVGDLNQQGILFYCDPPYKNSTGYSGVDKFDYESFYSWCRNQKKKGHIVLVSEYNMPDDFVCIWQKEHKTTLQTKQQDVRIEKLFLLAI